MPPFSQVGPASSEGRSALPIFKRSSYAEVDVHGHPGLSAALYPRADTNDARAQLPDHSARQPNQTQATPLHLHHGTLGACPRRVSICCVLQSKRTSCSHGKASSHKAACNF